MSLRGTSTAVVQIKGVEGIRRVLAPLLEPELTKLLDVGNKKAAQLLAKEVRADLRPVSKHMARAVRVKRAKTGKPGWVVGSRRKGAFFFHMVIGGTRAHGPRRAAALVFIPNWNPYIGASSHGIATGNVVRTQHVRGVRPNPVIARVAKRAESRAFAEVDKQIKT